MGNTTRATRRRAKLAACFLVKLADIWRQKPKEVELRGIPVLIRPSALTYPGVTVSRTQPPLIAAATITVRKSQGMSLRLCQVLFGESELARALGCT